MGFSVLPPLNQGEDHKRFISDVKRSVSISGAEVDRVWVRKAVNTARAKYYVMLQLHSSADVDKVINVYTCSCQCIDVKSQPVA